MVKHYSKQLDRTFFALSDPTRRAIIGNLAEKGECTVLQLAEPFYMSLPAVSKHLKLLESANLVSRERRGRVNYLKLRPEAIDEASAWLNAYGLYWQEQLDSLEHYTTEKKGESDDYSNTKPDSGSKQTH